MSSASRLLNTAGIAASACAAYEIHKRQEQGESGLTLMSTLGLIASFGFFFAAAHLHSHLQKRVTIGFDLYNQACQKVNAVATKHLILVDAQKQRLHFLEDGKHQKTYVISTAKKGTGQVENTNQTPLGLHEVHEKIGEGKDPRTVFKSRVAQKELWSEGDFKESFILSRILRLKGLSFGYNLGKNKEGRVVDSWDRYIYIHGTNRIDELGQAKSAGCVRMDPSQIISLFNRVSPGTHVYLYT